MDKYFLCLANSYKHGGRCIAGIEISYSNNSFDFVRDTSGTPVWIRPISHSAAGEVPNHHAYNVGIMDVVKISGAQYAGLYSHSEDYYYSSLSVIGEKLAKSESFLDKLTDKFHPTIFGNRGRALTPDAFQQGNYSLMLIKVENAEVYIDKRYEPKPRVKFVHNNNCYDLPITDPEYLSRIKHNDMSSIGNRTVLYMVLSIGVVHDGWHSKLVASIIEPQATQSLNIMYQMPTTASNPSFNTPIPPNNENPNLKPKPIRIQPKPIMPVCNVTNDALRIKSTHPQIDSQYRNTAEKKQGCYIATAVYGTYDCPEVWILRRFRDLILHKTWYGRSFIKAYYAISPILVKYFGQKDWFVTVCRKPLDKLVAVLSSKGLANTPYQDIV